MPGVEAFLIMIAVGFAHSESSCYGAQLSSILSSQAASATPLLEKAAGLEEPEEQQRFWKAGGMAGCQEVGRKRGRWHLCWMRSLMASCTISSRNNWTMSTASSVHRTCRLPEV